MFRHCIGCRDVSTGSIEHIQLRATESGEKVSVNSSHKLIHFHLTVSLLELSEAGHSTSILCIRFPANQIYLKPLEEPGMSGWTSPHASRCHSAKPQHLPHGVRFEADCTVS